MDSRFVEASAKVLHVSTSQDTCNRIPVHAFVAIWYDILL